MKKPLLLAVAVFFFAQCNRSTEQKPDAPHAGKNTLTEMFMQSFNAKPAAKSLYVKFEPSDKDIPRAQDAAILHLLADLKTQPQRFVIDATEKNELQGEYGTKISFEPNCFIALSGNEVSSAVQIELKECYALDEMLQENLTTTGNGKVLESKGAVLVSATCNGEEVKLKEGQKINIEFPFAVNGEDGYYFYYGAQKQTGINWVTVDGEEPPVAAKEQISKPEFSYKDYNLKEYLSAQLEYPDEAKRNELSANVEVSFVVDKNGKVKDVSCESAYKTFRDEIVATIQQMPKWKPATYGKKKISAQVKLNIDFNLRRKEQVVIDFNESNVTPLGKNNDYSFPDLVYEQSFDRLGWIGFNRVLNVSDTKADLIIRSDASTDVKIVLKSRNTIVSGENCTGYSRFKNLGVDAEVYVVAVRYESGNVFYSIQPLKLEKQTVVSLVWKKGSEVEVERMFKSLT